MNVSGKPPHSQSQSLGGRSKINELLTKHRNLCVLKKGVKKRICVEDTCKVDFTPVYDLIVAIHY